jgi:hypothetical protein
MQIGWPLSDGIVALMTVERRLNVQDVETLEGYLKTFKDALQKAPAPQLPEPTPEVPAS